jgi:SAM-dependent methyltransferase
MPTHKPEFDPERARLHAATVEHYADPHLYDHEYHRRRADVNYYRAVAAQKGRDLLELGCGSGRLLVPLVRDGARAVGLDYSQPMLRRCGERLARLRPERRARAHLVRGDFRRFALGRKFPLVLCPFNAMMHLYTRADVAAFLACVRAHLAPGGTFAFDVLNPDLTWLTRDPEKRWARTRFKDPRTGKSYFYTTNHTYDAATQIAWIRIFYDPADAPPSGRPPRTRIVHLAHRQFFPEELAGLLENNGFSVDAREGGFAGEPFGSGSDSQVCRCSIRG